MFIIIAIIGVALLAVLVCESALIASSLLRLAVHHEKFGPDGAIGQDDVDLASELLLAYAKAVSEANPATLTPVDVEAIVMNARALVASSG